MYKTISIDEFEQVSKRKALSIIDVREKEEYQAGHVPHAINQPLSELAQAKLTVNKEQEQYIICQSGGRSAKACTLLSKEGYQVVNVMGGTSAWRGPLI